MQSELFQQLDGGANPTSPLQCHQYKMRKLCEENEHKENLFGAYWDAIDKSLKKSIVRPVSFETAKVIVEKYEWLKCMPSIVTHQFGIFFDGCCGGVVCFGTDYTENLGVWDKYRFTGKMLLLNRGVCLHWTPIGSASRLIMRAIKMLPPQYEVITATVDELAGEIGTIYQACGFDYIGSMRENRGLSSKREAFMINGKLVGTRNMRGKIGTQKLSEVLKAYPDAVRIEQKAKSRYFYFRNKELRKNIEPFIKNYPKRAKEITSESA